MTPAGTARMIQRLKTLNPYRITEMPIFVDFTALCGEIPWLLEAYKQQRITDDGLKELFFFMADTKGKEVSTLLPLARQMLLEHVHLFLMQHPKAIINRLCVTKKIRTPGFMLERDLYRHCADIAAYDLFKKERFRLTLLRLYGPQANDLYQAVWRSDFAQSFARQDYVRVRTLLFQFAFRKISYVGGLTQTHVRQYESRLLRVAQAYSLDIGTLKQGFTAEYQHVAKDVTADQAGFIEAESKKHLQML